MREDIRGEGSEQREIAIKRTGEKRKEEGAGRADQNKAEIVRRKEC